MKLLLKKNYLAQIENSAKGENHLFRNFYVEKGGEVSDSLEDGKNSCAVLVSHILYSFNPLLEFSGKKHWIKYIHLTVASTEKDMLENGWYEINDLRPGAVIIWEERTGRWDGLLHHHIGFYVGDNMAISNDSKATGFPFRHSVDRPSSMDFTPRKVKKIFWHLELDND
ncbi:MAG: hypothetical protein HYT64_00970 [Candidatus Yanofskybacteria bacterium]|nr:hypothetical protein [Candidatus Yanofskybacteria bacterium]